jgi:hypothetical protein
MVLQQERQFNNGEDHQFSANATDGRRYNTGSNNNGFGRGKSKRFCTFCGKNGHTVDYCYSKHGFPDDVKYKSKGPGANCVDASSDYMEDDKVSSTKGKESYANAVDKSVFVDKGSSSNASKHFESMFSAEEFRRLKVLLQAPAGNGSNDRESHHEHQASTVTAFNAKGTFHDSSSISEISQEWVIDSGATDHICNSLSWFTVYRVISPISVRLPNGNTVLAKYVGEVNVTDSIILRDVLYIPQFAFNLLSVPKLTKDMNCKLFFTPTTCMLQDVNLRMIGLGRYSSGLYYLTSKHASGDSQLHTNNVNSCTILPDKAL